MAPPVDVLDAAQRLSDIYATALDHIRAELAQVGTDVNRTRLRRRLRDLERTITRRMAEVDAQARSWVDRELPRAYERGMGSFVHHTAAITGTPTSNVLVDFTMPSRPAVERLASGLTDNLLSATREVTQQAKREIRKAVSDAGMAKLVEGKSLGEAQQQVASALEAMGLGTVTYANGAQVALDAYADMAVRTTTAEAYNGGMVDAGRANDVEWFEVFDGPDCGWTDHDDDDLADGSIRHIDDCEANPTAHPNCLRSFGARPDITSADEAADAKPIGEEATPDTGTELAVAPSLPESVIFEPKGLDPEIAQQLQTQVAGYLAEYPQVAENFEYLGTTMGARKWYAANNPGYRAGRTPPRTYAEAIGGPEFMGRDPATGESRYRTKPGTLGIAQRWGSKPDELRTALAEDEAAGWHPRGTGSVEGIIAHEFGHQVFYLAKADAAVMQELEDTLVRVAQEAGQNRMMFMKENLSRYAAKNRDELMAEAFSEWKISPTPRPLAEALGRVLDGHYKV